MGRRKKAHQSCLEFAEDQHFQAMEAIKSFHRLALMLREQPVTGKCLLLLSHLGDQIQTWHCYSHYTYRNPANWPTYMDEREKAALECLVGRV